MTMNSRVITKDLPERYRIVHTLGAYFVEFNYGYEGYGPLPKAAKSYKTEAGARRYILKDAAR